MASAENLESLLRFETFPADAGARLDAWLAEHLADRSRVQIRRAITAGGVRVDGRCAKPAFRLRGGESISVQLPDLPPSGPQAEDIPLDILYEDEHLAAINKPPGMVVHPAKGHWSGTLTAALAFHFQQLSGVGGAVRPGVVHRLDRDTSGVIIIAKTDAAHLKLAEQFESRAVQKEYLAIVTRPPDRDRDRIEAPIGAHPYQREKMAIRSGHATSRPAETLYEVAARRKGFGVLRIFPKTGRTHQIRVHLAHIGSPVLCDRLYGGRAEITGGELAGGHPEGAVLLDRQALHARRIALVHPESGKVVAFSAPLAEDLRRVLDELQVAIPINEAGT